MKRVMVSPDRWRMFFRQFPKELEKLGLQSLPIVIIISIFIGAIMTIQTKLNTENPLLPAYSTGLVTRDTLLLEFSSTILCLILAGKIGSNIASEIGTIEQICAVGIPRLSNVFAIVAPQRVQVPQVEVSRQASTLASLSIFAHFLPISWLLPMFVPTPQVAPKNLYISPILPSFLQSRRASRGTRR